jgi:hypothetical protein
VRHPGLLQRRQLVAHIGQLGRIGDALGLDLQDGDLVEQLAEGDGNQNFGHGHSPHEGMAQFNGQETPFAEHGMNAGCRLSGERACVPRLPKL